MFPFVLTLKYIAVDPVIAFVTPATLAIADKGL